MPINVQLVNSDADVEKICDVLLELRNTFTRESLIAQVLEQRRQGYQIAFAEVDGVVVGVAGFVIGTKLAWDKHIYVDDLVTSERCRSTGVGERLIEWLKAYGR